MPAQKGRLCVLSYNTTGTTFVNIGGLREPTITINNEAVDVTSADEAGIRALLEGAGVTSVSIKAAGVYVNDTAVDAIRAVALANTHKQFKLTIPGATNKILSGTFMIASFEDSGSYNGSMNYSITLESTGPVTLA